MSPAVNVPSTNTLLWKVATPTCVDNPEIFKLVAVIIPEKFPFFHGFVVDPTLYKPAVFGINPEVNSPPTLMSSESESPRLIVPPLKAAVPIKLEDPATSKLFPTNKSPPVVVIPPADANVVIPH